MMVWAGLAAVVLRCRRGTEYLQCRATQPALPTLFTLPAPPSPPGLPLWPLLLSPSDPPPPRDAWHGVPTPVPAALHQLRPPLLD